MGFCRSRHRIDLISSYCSESDINQIKNDLEKLMVERDPDNSNGINMYAAYEEDLIIIKKQLSKTREI